MPVSKVMSNPTPYWKSECGRAVVYVGDCRDVMAQMVPRQFHAVVTDPPYGTDVLRDGYGRKEFGGYHINGDSDLSAMRDGLLKTFSLLKIGAWCACFCSPKRHNESVEAAKEAGFIIVGEVVWDKKRPGLGGRNGVGIRYQHELLMLLANGRVSGLSSIFSVIGESPPQQPYHPHDKPIPLLRQIVRYTCPSGGVVLDPFMGSGSTGCAAVEEGMWFVGIEQSQEYADIAIGRLRLSLDKTPVGVQLETGKEVEAQGVAPPPPRKLR